MVPINNKYVMVSSLYRSCIVSTWGSLIQICVSTNILLKSHWLLLSIPKLLVDSSSKDSIDDMFNYYQIPMIGIVKNYIVVNVNYLDMPQNCIPTTSRLLFNKLINTDVGSAPGNCWKVIKPCIVLNGHFDRSIMNWKTWEIWNFLVPPMNCGKLTDNSIQGIITAVEYYIIH